MPSRNIVKEYSPNSYYHVYNRGVNKRLIFKDETDYAVFLNLLKRYLGGEAGEVRRNGYVYPSHMDQIQLLAFCLMSSHFHLLIYQMDDDKAIAKFMQSLCTAYTMYFNRRYKRVGRLFQGTFKASRVSQDEYLLHISRYIHLNPKNYQNYEWSSFPYYLGSKKAHWVKPSKILALFSGAEDYRKFLADYEDYRESLDKIRSELANS